MSAEDDENEQRPTLPANRRDSTTTWPPTHTAQIGFNPHVLVAADLEDDDRSSMDSDLSSLIEIEPQPVPEEVSKEVNKIPELSRRGRFWLIAALSLVHAVFEIEMMGVAVWLVQFKLGFGSYDGPFISRIIIPYTVAGAVGVMIWSKAGDLWGYRLMLLITLTFSFFGCLTCSLAIYVQNYYILIVGRALHGTGAPGGLVLTSSITTVLLSPQDVMKARVSITVISVFLGLGCFVGMAVVTEQRLPWVLFLFQAPVPMLAFIMCWASIRLPHGKASVREIVHSLDLIGAVSLAGSLSMFFVVVAHGGLFYEWSSRFVVGLLTGSILLMMVFFVFELHFVEYPLLPIHIFNNRNVASAIGSAFFQTIPSSTGVYLWPFLIGNFWNQDGSTPIYYSLPFYLSMNLSALASTAVLAKMGRYLVVTRISNILLLIGTGVATRASGGPIARLIVILVIFGIGSGSVLPPGKAAMQANVSAQYLSSTVAMVTMLQMIATALGITLTLSIQNISLFHDVPSVLSQRAREWVEKEALWMRWVKVAWILSDSEFQKTHVDNFKTDSFTHSQIVPFACAIAGCIVTMFLQDREWTDIRSEVLTGMQAEEERRRIAQRRKANKRARVAGNMV